MKYSAKIYRQFIFTHKFFRFLLTDRIEIKKDNIVLITGKRGSGKSTLAVKIAIGFSDTNKLEENYNEEFNITLEEKEEHKLEGYQEFDMNRDLVFDKETLQMLCEEGRQAFILADEAIVATGRKNTMTRANKLLHQVLTINRKNSNTIFFLLPSIEDFDISILQYVSHWIHIDDRGLGAVMLPNPPSIFGRKSWDIDKMKKVYEKFLEDNPSTQQVPYWLFDNFRGYIKFSKLSKTLEEKYLDLAHQKKNGAKEKEGEKTEDKRKKPGLDEVKRDLVRKIAQELIDGTINDPQDYYKYCAELDFKKIKLNKEVNEMLASLGDGRSATKAIRDNHNKEVIKNRENLGFDF